MSTREALLARIAAYCEARVLSERHFGLLSVRDHKFVGRLRDGKATLTTIERAERFMDEAPAAAEPERAA